MKLPRTSCSRCEPFLVGAMFVIFAVVEWSPVLAQSPEFLVSDRATNQVLRYDATNGNYLGGAG